MATGIRATVEFDTPGSCPLLQRSTGTDGVTVDEAMSNVTSSGEAPSVTDFSVTGDLEVGDGIVALFEGGDSNRYRLVHDDGVGCPCECLGELGIPVARYLAREGRLTLVFYAAGYEELKEAVAELRDRYPGVDVKRFVRSPTGEQPRDSVFIDRNRLTARQLEVLRTALDMGYFERPRGANATEVADALDINPSTFSEHLAAAQRKLLEDVLERGQ